MKKYHHAVRAFAMTLVKKYSVSGVSKRMDIPRSTNYTDGNPKASVRRSGSTHHLNSLKSRSI